VPAPPDPEVDVLIAFKKDPGKADHAFVRKQGGTIKETWWLVPAMAARIPLKAVAALSKNKNIDIVEPDLTFQAVDLELDNAWGVKRIGAGLVHPEGHTGMGVKVAILDTGIDYTHPDLDANYAGGWDFVNNDSDPRDDNSHGTHIAGTIAAEDDGYGVVGVAPQVRIYALKVMSATGSGSFSRVISALQWCVENGIHVTNNSYGSSYDPGSTVRQAFDNAYAAGVVSIAAAGNSGTSDGAGENVCYPAAYPSVVAVAATASGDSRAYFSSTGSQLELAAPGASIYSTMPGGGYGGKSGTSMACPHVVGAAALLVGAGVTGGDDLRLFLAMSAQDLGAAGWDAWYGYGLVDVAAAIALVGTAPAPQPEPEPEPEPSPAPEPGIASVDSIAYSLSGGKSRNKNLNVSLHLTDDIGNPVAGASVSVAIARNGAVVKTASATTDAAGNVACSVSNARSGTYSTLVTAVSASPLTWDGLTPANAFTK
jgi:subtilisin